MGPETTYTHVFTIANKGTSAALGPIVLTIALDPSTPFVSYAGTGWLCTTAGSDVTCTNLANFNAGTSTQISLDVLINADIGATPTSSARVAAMNDSDDTDSASNVLAVTLQVEQLPLTGIDVGTTGPAALLLLLLGAVAVLASERKIRA